MAIGTLSGTPDFFSCLIAARYQLRFSLKIAQIFSGWEGGDGTQPVSKRKTTPRQAGHAPCLKRGRLLKIDTCRPDPVMAGSPHWTCRECSYPTRRAGICQSCSASSQAGIKLNLARPQHAARLLRSGDWPEKMDPCPYGDQCQRHDDEKRVTWRAGRAIIRRDVRRVAEKMFEV